MICVKVAYIANTIDEKKLNFIKFIAISGIWGNPALKVSFTDLFADLDVRDGSTHKRNFELWDCELKISINPAAVK